MISEPFAIGDQIIHRVDPRFKIVFAALFSMVVAVSYRFPALVWALGVSILLVACARLNLVAVGRRLLVIIGFLLLLWIVLPITFEGAPLKQFGPFTITRAGVVLAAQISLKSASILLAFIGLVATMNFATLGHALGDLRIPDKIVHLLLITYRYVFLIDQEFQRLARATKIRGFQPGTNLHTYRTFAYLVAMLFVRSASRAERVHQAMLCRGFHGRFYRLTEFPSHPRNWAFAVLMAVAVFVLVLLEWTKIL
jgi:cobalt/nickel transport system permease protein